MNIVVAGYVAQYPISAFFWHAVSFALGFRALGHDVWFLEDSGDYPWGWDMVHDREDDSSRAGTAFLAREMPAVGLQDRWVFRHVPSGRHDGMDAATTDEVLAAADVFVNVSCLTPMRPEYRRISHRLAIDTDPVFTQVKIAEAGRWSVICDDEVTPLPEAHTRLFTFGRPPLPAQRHEWVPTRQPVAIEYWPELPPPPADAPFTTLASWRAHPAVRWEGRHLGGKDLAFMQYADLPSRVSPPLAVGLGGRDRDLGHAFLLRHGWSIADARAASVSTEAYRRFIGGSMGELSVAKHGYVVSRCGWFSERTCSYMACGRPAIVQDTGFTDWLPTGEGLVAFSTPGEAAAAVEEVTHDWPRHARTARQIVAEHFDAARVCAELLEAAL